MTQSELAETDPHVTIIFTGFIISKRPVCQILFRVLLLDPKWMTEKLESASGNILPVIKDYKSSPPKSSQSVISSALRLAAGMIARDPKQLCAQLASRLLSFQHPKLQEFVEACNSLASSSGLIATTATLTPPGTEIGRLEGHLDRVRALVMLPSGELASGSSDRTIRIWDVHTNAQIKCFEGHREGIRVLITTPDGRLASGSTDNTIRLWDLNFYSLQQTLYGHNGRVRTLLVLPSGQLASGSDDCKIGLWDSSGRREPMWLEGHTRGVRALALLPNGSLVSGAADRTIRIWDYNRLRQVAEFATEAPVRAMLALLDGRIAVASSELRKIIESAQPFSSKMHSRFHRRCTPIFMKVHTQGAVLRTHARVDSGI